MLKFDKVFDGERLQERGVDKTLFIKHFESRIIIVQIYVDDIIFGSTSDSKV